MFETDDLPTSLERSRNRWRLVAAASLLTAIASLLGVWHSRDTAAPLAGAAVAATPGPAATPPAGTAAAPGATGQAAVPGTASTVPALLDIPGAVKLSGEPASLPGEGLLPGSAATMPAKPRRLALEDGQLREEEGEEDAAVERAPVPASADVSRRSPEAVRGAGAVRHRRAPAVTPRPNVATSMPASAHTPVKLAKVENPAPAPRLDGSPGETRALAAAAMPAQASQVENAPASTNPADAGEHVALANNSPLAGSGVANGEAAALVAKPAASLGSRSDVRPATLPKAGGALPASLDSLMREGRDYERSGKYEAASRAYRQAADRGHGPASLRLAELLLEGPMDLKRDYVQAVYWYEKAREQGAEVPVHLKR